MSYKVICEQTGEVYNSQSDAANDLDLEPRTLSNHIIWNNPQSIKGLTFTRLER